MKDKPVIPREQANRDVDAAFDWYLNEATPEAGLGFVTALEKAYGHIGRHPVSSPVNWTLDCRNLCLFGFVFPAVFQRS